MTDGFVLFIGDVVALTDTCRVLASSVFCLLVEDVLEDHLNQDRRGRLLSWSSSIFFSSTGLLKIINEKNKVDAACQL